MLTGDGGCGPVEVIGTANAPDGQRRKKMKYIFTKRFFDLSVIDQSRSVDAVLREVDQCWLSEQDQKRAERMQKRIIAKAVKYGVFASDGE
jgi:hypothetical protein